jgi:DNA-directed RNA polymerase III subunit RPC1
MSSYLITRKDTFYDHAAFTLMCTYMGDAAETVDLPTPAILKVDETSAAYNIVTVLSFVYCWLHKG